MCMTMGDPTWAFVLAATEIWHLTVQPLMCRPLKFPRPRFHHSFLWKYARTPAHMRTTLFTSTHICAYTNLHW